MNNIQPEPHPKPVSGRTFGVRHLQVLLLTTCLAVAVSMRVNLSVSIVAMTNSTRGNPDFADYTWPWNTQSILLTSFSWGYVVTQIPAGQLGQMYGPKMFLLGAMVICSVFSILTPLAAQVGDWQFVCMCRVLQGLSQGFCYPCAHILLARWSSLEERGSFTACVYSGVYCGMFITLPICGALVKSSVGWPSLFYLFGGLGLLWSVAWYFLGANNPESHKFISEEETLYIKSSVGRDVGKRQKRSTPWVEIYTSGAMWGIILAHCGASWGFWIMLNESPNYLNYILELDMADDAILSALPYFVHWLSSFGFAWISKYLITRNILRVEISRKIFNTIGLGIPALLLIGLTFVPEDHTTLAVTLLTVSVGMTSSCYVGYYVNHIDLSPNYAGTMMGISNCAASIFIMAAPLIDGVIVKDQNNASHWHTVFYVAAGVYVLTTITYLLLAKGLEQVWNDVEYKSKRRKCF